jgi:flagellar hook protein FlgE
MSSLFSALTTAVAGLTAQSSAIGNISDNLANAQTTGYKAVGTNFQELVNASNATNNNPGGVRATPQYQNDVQGSISSSNTATSLAISGEGYFAVETATTNAAGVTNFNSQNYYTRQGDFTLDKNGYLVNGSGYYLTGYAVDSKGVTNTSATQPIQVSALLDNPVATTNVNYVANLPSNVTSTASAPFSSSTSTVAVYDALGNTYNLQYTWTKSTSATNSWDLIVDATSGASSGSTTADFTTTIPFTFNDGTSGSAGTISAISPTAAAGSSYTVSTPTGAGAAASVTIPLQFPGISSQNVVLNFGTYGGSTGVTQFADNNSTVTVTNFDQNGLSRGSFNNLSVDENGLVTLNYSNGTTKSIAQIPIVQFYAQDELQRVTGGALEATLASGTPRYSIAGTTGAGTLSSSSLEQSNVDIATQFTQLVQAQQVYSANAKIVTTDDSLLQTTINMVQ